MLRYQRNGWGVSPFGVDLFLVDKRSSRLVQTNAVVLDFPSDTGSNRK